MQAQNLEATPTLQGNKVKWTLCHNKQDSKPCGDAPGNYPKVDVEHNADVPFKITIVGDTTGLGIKYASDPLWAQWGTQKPSGGWSSKPSGNDTDQLVDMNVTNNTVLHFRDTNSKAGDIKYQLNFVDKNGNKVDPLDPDIRNGGTTPPPPPPPPPGATTWGSDSSSVFITAGVISALVAAVVAYLVVRLMGPRGPTDRSPGA